MSGSKKKITAGGCLQSFAEHGLRVANIRFAKWLSAGNNSYLKWQFWLLHGKQNNEFGSHVQAIIQKLNTSKNRVKKSNSHNRTGELNPAPKSLPIAVSDPTHPHQVSKTYHKSVQEFSD